MLRGQRGTPFGSCPLCEALEYVADVNGTAGLSVCKSGIGVYTLRLTRKAFVLSELLFASETDFVETTASELSYQTFDRTSIDNYWSGRCRAGNRT